MLTKYLSQRGDAHDIMISNETARCELSNNYLLLACLCVKVLTRNIILDSYGSAPIPHIWIIYKHCIGMEHIQ